MVMTIILLVPTGLSQPAFAHFPNCLVGTLQNNELLVSANDGSLYKVIGTDGHACLAGKIVLAAGGAGINCDDIAIDHSDLGRLYCLAAGTDLFEVNRTPGAGGVGALELKATFLGDLRLASNGDSIETVNAFEIALDGTTYVASGADNSAAFGTTGGQLFSVDLGKTVAADAGKLTLLADFTDKFRSAGDLALDQQAIPHDLYWTVKCRQPGGVTVPPFVPIACGNQNHDALFRIDLETLPAAGALVFVADLGIRDIFAMEYVGTGQPNLCFLTMQGNIFETDLSGTKLTTNYPGDGIGTTAVFGGGVVNALGATANYVGGLLLDIDKMALVVAGVETNASWLLLFLISSLGLVAYQFTSKTNTRKIKNI